MNILAMDTSGVSLSVALLRGETLVYECLQQNGKTHSDTLMPLVESAMQAGRLSVTDIDCFAVTVGPGSFTGVRIGVSTAKALAHATGKPVAAIDALEAMAAGVGMACGIICPLQDARAGQVYCAAYRDGQAIAEDRAMKLTEFLASLPAEERCCFVGDGAIVHRGTIQDTLGERACFAPANRMAVRASEVALLAAQRQGTWQGWQSVLPYYLRAPQAERERLRKESTHG